MINRNTRGKPSQLKVKLVFQFLLQQQHASSIKQWMKFFIFQNFDFLMNFWHEHLFQVFMPKGPHKVKILKNKNISLFQNLNWFCFVVNPCQCPSTCQRPSTSKMLWFSSSPLLLLLFCLLAWCVLSPIWAWETYNLTAYYLKVVPY